MFLFNDTATTEIYTYVHTLSLHAALPICQFNVRYCVANAIVRKSSRLEHFTNEAVTDPTVGALAARIETRLDPALLDGTFENASRATVAVPLKDGRVLRCAPTGTPGNIGSASCRERV